MTNVTFNWDFNNLDEILLLDFFAQAKTGQFSFLSIILQRSIFA